MENGRMDTASVLDITSDQLVNSYPSVSTDCQLEEGKAKLTSLQMRLRLICFFAYFLGKTVREFWV